MTKFRNTILKTFDEVKLAEIQDITHKNLAIGYAQAMRGEGVSSDELKARMKSKAANLREKQR